MNIIAGNKMTLWGQIKDFKEKDGRISFTIGHYRKVKEEFRWTNHYCTIFSPNEYHRKVAYEGNMVMMSGEVEDYKRDDVVYRSFLVRDIRTLAYDRGKSTAPKPKVEPESDQDMPF